METILEENSRILEETADTDPFSLVDIILLFYSVKHQEFIIVFYIT